MQAEFYLDGKKVYYEVYGEEGDILILLNGLMMSTASWTPFIEPLSRHRRLVLVDFFDQGQSERLEEGYNHDIQVELLEGLSKELEAKYGQSAFNVAGVSYGSEVAIQFAIKYKNRVRRLILANAAARTSRWLKQIGDGWNLAAQTGRGDTYYFSTIPVIYSTKFFEDKKEWMDNREQTLIEYFSDEEVLKRLVRLTRSSEDYDATDRLSEIKCPTLIISGSEDCLIPVSEQLILRDGIPGSIHITLNGSGHASFYENPEGYAALVGGFADLGTERMQIV